MSRKSAFAGTWQPNKRPYITLTPDVYVSIQGQVSVIGCGECLRVVNFNKYITGVSTEASIDSAPGSATVTLSIPDTDVSDFFVDGQLLIIPMMEIEVYAKGHFLIGGFPQYYRIFWGLVSSVTKAWSNGTTTITIACKDILRWWELTNVTTNPGFIESFGSSTGNFTFWGNQFAGKNPYTIMIALARESMGDFSLTTGSFTSFLPEKGPEGRVIASYAKDIMAYWQLKFANIWNSLVLYGTSGQAYSFSGESGTFSPVNISAKIFKEEERLNFLNQQTNLFKISPSEIATFKQSIDRAVDFEFFQSETQSKLALAMSCRDQAGYEFYCDPSGDIVFKPPFYNLNVMPNKPVSWIQDIDILDDSIVDSEAEVYTHITSSGNAFGGVMDYGLNDEITTPRAGAFDFHLLRRYGWRRFDYQCEWAGNPRKLFFHLLDYLDRLNAKRQHGSITIPMRPELRLGFPVWVPKYDSFFYVSGISHSYAVGGQVTTTITLIAKRSKFIAPNNIGEIKQTGVIKKKIQSLSKNKQTQEYNEASWSIEFPDRVGSTTGLTQDESSGKPVIVRDPKTGKALGFPDVVMVFRSSHKGEVLSRIIESMGRIPPKKNVKGGKSPQNNREGTDFNYQRVISDTFRILQSEERNKLIQRLRAHRYEAGVTNAGAYDYAFDKSRQIKELVLVPVDSVVWNPSTSGGSSSIPNTPNVSGGGAAAFTVRGKSEKDTKREIKKLTDTQIAAQQLVVNNLKKDFNAAVSAHRKGVQALEQLKKLHAPKKPVQATNTTTKPSPEHPEVVAKSKEVAKLKSDLDSKQSQLQAAELEIKKIRNNESSVKLFSSLNMMIRPVSDEFGFEVIGHYKYGRGAFIDRGQIQVRTGVGDAAKIANQLNIQFAPTGGFLTDGPSATNLDPLAESVSSAFEKMQPDDYVTGASFRGFRTDQGAISEVVMTSQSTYTNLVNANVGKGVYIEADQLRRSRTLGELSPTLEISGFDQGHKPCTCALSSPRWLSFMPREFVSRVLQSSSQFAGAAFETANTIRDPKYQEDADAVNKDVDAQVDARNEKLTKDMAELIRQFEKDKAMLSSRVKSIKSELPEKTGSVEDPYRAFLNKEKVIRESAQKDISAIEQSRKERLSKIPKTNATLGSSGKVDPNGVAIASGSGQFFKILSDFLEEQFRKTYESYNLPRERSYTLSDRNVEVRQFDNTVSSGLIENNTLSLPDSSLFNRAASGDPDALRALQSGANFNFGRTNTASEKFGQVWEATTSSENKPDQPGTSAVPFIKSPTIGTALLNPKFASPTEEELSKSPAITPFVAPLPRNAPE